MKYDYDLLIIGAGSAGMAAGEFAGRLGLRTALVEHQRFGGDCLWTGCVPSKALLASARIAHAVRSAADYGITVGHTAVDSAAVWQRLRAIQEEIATTDDNPERYSNLGIEVVQASAAFEGDHLIRLGERTVRTRYVLVCTGSRPSIPEIEGLTDAGYLTSENLFELRFAPRSLLVVGGGPIGIEMAQAMCRLGIETTVLQNKQRILPRDEPELSDVLMRKLQEDGVTIELGAEADRVQLGPNGKVIDGKIGDQPRDWTAEEILVAAGRRPNIESLRLDEARIKYGPHGIEVDRRLRTSVRWVYAAGDCAGRYLFTHSAGFEAVTAIRNMFFPGSATPPKIVPWTTFTEPELAHVGMTSGEAAEKLGRQNTRVFRWKLSHSDRARADGETAGGLVVVTDSRFRLLGAHILAPAAGEMIAQFTLGIRRGMRLTPDFGNLVQVYPTYSTSVSQLAGEATYGQLMRPFLRALKRINDILDRR
jgi:pyruvate/2-oxoglutarate dehydrogenase complex dihydrolipoamide dehydrogenase (E3) component